MDYGLWEIRLTSYITMIPRKFILETGETITLKAIEVETKLVKETVFRLWVPNIKTLYRYLVKEHGFEKAFPAIPKGEAYSLRKPLDDVWELHLRLYSNGFIDAEVEVKREYLEHLTKRLNIIYEAYEFYRDVYNKLHILYAPTRKWITKIIDHFYVKLRDPDTLTPWKPIAIGIAVAGLLTYALLNLTKRGENEPKN